MSMCRVFFLSCWKGVFAVTSVFSWQNSISLCPASFCTSRPNLPVTPGVSWLPTFAFWSPIMKRTSFLMLVLEGLVGLHRTVQLQLLQRYWSGHRFGLPWYWMVCLGIEQRSFCLFEIASKYIDNNYIYIYVYVYIYTHTHMYTCIFFIHSSVDRYLGCSHLGYCT